MTNWQKSKIVGTFDDWEWGRDSIRFTMDRRFDFSDGGQRWIYCVNRYPFNTWQVGDELEIDIDQAKNVSYHDYIRDTNMVRKTSSTTAIATNSSSPANLVVSTSSGALPSEIVQQVPNIAQALSNAVDATGGRNEYEYKIQVNNQHGDPVFHSLICRRNPNYNG